MVCASGLNSWQTSYSPYLQQRSAAWLGAWKPQLWPTWISLFATGSTSNRHPAEHPSRKSAVLLQQRNHISDLFCVGFAGLEMVAELDEIALSLALSSDSRAFSLLICSSLCSIAYCRTLVSIVGCQLAVLRPSPRRQRCKELLLVAVNRRKRLPGGRHGCSRCGRSRPEAIERDQSEKDGGENRDPTLTIESNQNGSQTNSTNC